MESQHPFILLLKFICYKIFSIIWNILQKSYWICNGTNQQLQKCRKPGDNYESCAQVFSIKLRFSIDKLSVENFSEDFLGFHEEFVHPKYVLKNEVSLYCVDDEYSIFVEAPAGIQVWKHQYGSFHKPAQFNNAIRYIKMPTWALHQLADELGDPPATVIITEFLPRSGSTLLCQLFESTDKCVVFSEPNMFQTLLSEEMQKMDEQQYFKSCLRLLCKPIHGMDVQAFMIKMVPPKTEIKKIVQMVVPNSKFLFLYRDILKCTQSLAGISNALPFGRIVFGFDDLIPHYPRDFFINYQIKVWKIPLNNAIKDVYMATDNLRLLQAFLLQASTLKIVINQRKEDDDLPAIKYEHLAANPASCLTAIFEHCGLHKELVEPALLAMKNDSQANSFLSKQNVLKLKNAKVTTIDVQMQEQMKRIAEELDIPLLKAGEVMPYTITQ